MNPKKTAKERLLAFLSYKCIGQKQFETMCGLSNGYINNSKGNFGAKKVDDILQAFPDLDRVWLLTGEGTMLRSRETGSVAVADNGGAAAVGGSAVAGDIGRSIEMLVEEMKREREAHTSQVDRLLAIIERMQNADPL